MDFLGDLILCLLDPDNGTERYTYLCEDSHFPMWALSGLFCLVYLVLVQ